ncbi:BED zinc finger [Cooperia oncophora]
MCGCARHTMRAAARSLLGAVRDFLDQHVSLHTVMNSGEADGPACPVAIHPYGMTSAGALTMNGIGSGALQMGPIATTTTLGSAVSLPTGLALGNIDITNSWCQFPSYHDIRPVENGSYESEIASINYQDISTAQKYEPLKYDYGDIRPKQYEEQRLYHKEPDRPTVKEEEVKFEHEDRCDTAGRDGGAAPAKRGRPTENPCWGYFIRLDDQNVRCRLCNKVVKSACATNMTKHLERHHQQDYQQLIVQIKQYRQQKGPVSSGVSSPETHQQSCILSTNQYVKTENYAQQLYSQFEREDVLRNCTGYDRHDPSITWQRNQWNQWPNTHDPTTSSIDMTGVLHGCLASPPTSWTAAAPGTSGATEKPYMKRNRKTEHPVWEYFKRTADGNAQCGICTGVVKSPCSSNFMRHLMRHHSSEYNDVYVKWVQKRAPNK